MQITLNPGAAPAEIERAITTWRSMFAPTLHTLHQTIAESNGVRTIGPDVDPGDYRVTFGKFNGLTIAQIWQDTDNGGPGYVRGYLAESAYSAVTRTAAKDYAARMDRAAAEAEDHDRDRAREELAHAADSDPSAGSRAAEDEDLPF